MAEINTTIVEETPEYRIIQETYDARPGDVGYRLEHKTGREFNREQIVASLDAARTRIAAIRNRDGTIRTRAQEIRSGYAGMTAAQKNQAVQDLADQINDLAGAQNDIAKMILDVRRYILNDVDSGPDA